MLRLAVFVLTLPLGLATVLAAPAEGGLDEVPPEVEFERASAEPGASAGAAEEAGGSAEAPAPEPAPPAAEAGAPDADEREADEADATTGADQVIDLTLPSGLRVITAKDASLPVASVVLAVEVGTRDDPDALPGLVHALAYHLQQGNRELAPGEAIATAHDVGGLAAMAVGPAQVRFESAIPVSQLDAQLRAESQRLRAPNIGRTLWLKSLSYARGDQKVRHLVPPKAAAAAWQDPGMEHDGRQVSKGLGDMLDQAVGAQLSRLYDYRGATLVVVGPDEPDALLARVEPLFADLPARPRKPMTPAAAPKPNPKPGPRVVRVEGQRGDSLLWAVPGNPSARAWAQVMCGTINRQQRGQNDRPKARVRCTYADDPRRPLLVLRALGYDPALGPEPLIASRLDRIAHAEREPELAALVENQRVRMVGDISFALRTPLELASYLASAVESGGKVGVVTVRDRNEILGLPVLPGDSDASSEPSQAEPAGDAAAGLAEAGEDPEAVEGARAAATLAATIPSLLDTRAAVILLDPKQEVPPPLQRADDPAPGAEAEDGGAGDGDEAASEAKTAEGEDQAEAKAEQASPEAGETDSAEAE